MREWVVSFRTPPPRNKVSSIAIDRIAFAITLYHLAFFLSNGHMDKFWIFPSCFRTGSSCGLTVLFDNTRDGVSCLGLYIQSTTYNT